MEMIEYRSRYKDWTQMLDSFSQDHMTNDVQSFVLLAPHITSKSDSKG